MICEGKIKLPKNLIGLTDDNCHNIATQVCEDCGKHFCFRHISSDKHKCDDSIKGCHSMLKDKE